MPPAKRPPPQRATKVRAHYRAGTRVKSHNRKLAWMDARAAWGGAAVSGVTTLGLLAQMGVTLLSTVALIITALLGLLAVLASEQSTKNHKRIKAAARKRKPAAKRTTRRR